MTAEELLAQFRAEVYDAQAPYLWSDPEVFRYMNDAYRMFVRLTGGIPDSTSDITTVAVTARQARSDVSPLILKFRSAYLISSGRRLDILNDVDEPLIRHTDYGGLVFTGRNNAPGPVHSMVIGEDRSGERGQVRWINVPAVNDTVRLSVYRLPLDPVPPGGAGFDFPEIGEEHVEHLTLWMKHRAYGKQDAETFDANKRNTYEAAFRGYCAQAKAEWDRYRSKVQVVQYGGL